MARVEGSDWRRKNKKKAETVPWPSFTSEREHISAGLIKHLERGAAQIIVNQGERDCGASEPPLRLVVSSRPRLSLSLFFSPPPPTRYSTLLTPKVCLRAESDARCVSAAIG